MSPWPIATAVLVLVACRPGQEAEDTGLATVEQGEWLPGGSTTNTVVLDANAFLQPAVGLSSAHRAEFFSGYGLFAAAWQVAPGTTNFRDGLGPHFHAPACASCHVNHGRAAPPEAPGDDLSGLLVRLSVPGTDATGAPLPEPVYGGQLQDHAIPGLTAEGRPELDWEELPGTYEDGEAYSLRRPSLRLEDLAFGALEEDTRTSVRMAQQMVGLGLLEGIPVARLEALADPDDSDGDGISGRINSSWDAELGAAAAGRFGWKAEQPRVRTQTAGALAGDMGITSSIFPTDDCTPSEEACLASPSGGSPEIADTLLEQLSVFSEAVAVPMRRDWEDPTVLRGKRLFYDAACDACHTPAHTTDASAPLPELADQRIWPYTDLLLHDLGPELADGREVFGADGQEWRTPPLWSLGLIPLVNKHDTLLHDGRARGFAEAILWHGGEAEGSKEAFRSMDAEDREALVAFLADL